MHELLLAISDWRFPSCVAFVAAFLGPWIFRRIPLPAEAARQLERFQRAQVAEGLAKNAGITGVEQMAKLAGLASGYGMISSLKRQHRQSLVVGILLAAVLCSVLFLYAPVQNVPGWIFIAAAAFGVIKLWRAW